MERDLRPEEANRYLKQANCHPELVWGPHENRTMPDEIPKQVRDDSAPQWITLPGLLDYEAGLKIMEDRLLEVIGGSKPNTIFLSEYNPVYTAGTSYKAEELLTSRFPVIYTGRGGKFTYHGPGQRVIYPIIDLDPCLRGDDAESHKSAPPRHHRESRDLKLYIKTLENWIISTLASFKIDAFIIPGKVGVWVLKNGQHAKIGAIGVRVKKWVTYHGMAVNINPNLEHFSGIIPCGINEFPVTSLKDIGVNISMEEFDVALKRSW